MNLVSAFGEKLADLAGPTHTITPIEDWIVYRYEDTGEGRIVIADTADPSKSPRKKIMVLAVGPGRVQMNGQRIPVMCKPGDRIAVRAGAEIYAYDFNGKVYAVRESDVVGVIEPVRDGCAA